MDWAELERRQPGLARLGRRRLLDPGVVLVATIRGTARAEVSPDVQARYAAAVGASLGWVPEPGRFHLFAVTIGEVTFIRYDDASGDQHVARWPPPREFIRRGTTATSLGPSEPAQSILVAGT